MFKVGDTVVFDPPLGLESGMCYTEGSHRPSETRGYATWNASKEKYIGKMLKISAARPLHWYEVRAEDGELFTVLHSWVTPTK